MHIRRRREVQKHCRRVASPTPICTSYWPTLPPSTYPSGLLVYARGEAEVATYEVRCSGKRLEVAALDLSGGLDEVLARVRSLARKVREMGDEARRRAPAGLAVGAAGA